MDRIPDNFDFFDAYDRKQAAWEASLPVCDCCGCHMAEWYRIPQKFGDLLVCTECATKEEYEEE